MKRPPEPIEARRRLEAFFEQLAFSPQRVLLLDQDGALAPLRVERDQAMPYPALARVLDEIHEAGHTRLVIISGRYTQDLLPLLGMRRVPEMWGSHGWERRLADGHTEIGKMEPRALQGLAEADDWVDAMGLEERREVKPGCLALYLRGLPERVAQRLRMLTLGPWVELARRYGLDLTEFDGGIELGVPGRSKGNTVRTIMNELADGAAVAFLGDDRTDEAGFEALAGRGLSALVRPEFRPTHAEVWIKPPEELFAFLHRWQEAASQRVGRSQKARR